MQIEQLTNDLHYAVALMEAFHLTSSPPYTQLKDLARDLEYCELVRYSPDAGRYALALLDRLAAILREFSGNATFRIPEGQLLCIEEDIAALSEDMRQYARIVRPADCRKRPAVVLLSFLPHLKSGDRSMSAEDLHSWFLARTGPVCAYKVEDQYQLFSTRRTAMVKLVDTSDKLQPAILVRNAVFNRFRNMLPAVQRAQLPLKKRATTHNAVATPAATSAP
jgi:hypothetical protein